MITGNEDDMLSFSCSIRAFIGQGLSAYFAKGSPKTQNDKEITDAIHRGRLVAIGGSGQAHTDLKVHIRLPVISTSRGRRDN